MSILGALAVTAGVAGCGGDGDDVADPPTTTASTTPQSPVERGESLVEVRGCLACHSTDGRAGVGPTWQGLAGSTVQLADGTEVVADAAYLKRSILEPDADIVEGYSSGVMTAAAQPGSISEEDAEAMVAYLQTLQ